MTLFFLSLPTPGYVGKNCPFQRTIRPSAIDGTHTDKSQRPVPLKDIYPAVYCFRSLPARNAR
jgi:hypothetical protein